MTIMFITHYSSMYGANRSLLDLIDGLRGYDIKPIVVVPEQGVLVKILKQKNIDFIIQDFKNWNFVHYSDGSMRNLFFYYLKRMRLAFQVNKYNLRAVSLLHSKVLHLKIDLIYSNSSVFNFGFVYSQKFSIPHIWHFRETQEHYNFKWIFNKSYVNRSFRNSDLIIAISQFIKKNYRLKNELDNIKVEYDSVLSRASLNELDKRRNQYKSKNPEVITFGIVGVLDHNKRQMEAVIAMSEVVKINKNVRLLVVGGGDVKKLKSAVNKLKLNDYVEVLGEMKNPFDAFIQMDVYLMCSRKEGLGRVTLEAMACNLPIIGYKDGGTVELIQENVNGFFYEKDYKELAAKMLVLINDKELRARFGIAGRTFFEKLFLNDISAKNIYDHINTIKLN
jgi:glycosyltransferase involved in cell wall biosynthesis